MNPDKTIADTNDYIKTVCMQIGKMDEIPEDDKDCTRQPHIHNVGWLTL